jgi:phage shock protein A
MEHSSPEALKEYFHEHPNADPKNHHVEKSDKGSAKSKSTVQQFTKSTELLYDTVAKMKDQISKLQGTFEKAVGYHGDKEKAQKAAEKINYAYQHATGSAETALHHAQSALNLAKSMGADSLNVQRVEKYLEETKKTLDEAKAGNSSKDIKGDHSESLAVRSKVETVAELEHSVKTMLTYMNSISKE